jgi:hypothetical protein
MIKKTPENKELKKLRKLAEQDPDLLAILDSLKSEKAEKEGTRNQERRLRMPYVNSESLGGASWK